MTALRALAAIMWILVFMPPRERPMAWGSRFLRAPQPSGWTLTDVLSRPRTSGSMSCSCCRRWNTRSKTPLAAQRLIRM